MPETLKRIGAICMLLGVAENAIALTKESLN